MSSQQDQGGPIGFERHDHRSCVDTAMSAAETLCQDRHLRFTPVRRKALEILLERHQAMGAYEVLDRLQEAGLGSQPPAAYRALDFLVAHGLAHRIERLNAYIACSHPGEEHLPGFLICRVCSRVAETVTIPARRALDQAASGVGFRIERILLEAEGVCAACAGAPSA